MDELFGDPISTYTWQQAVEDGVLVRTDDKLRREAGYQIPVLLSAQLSDRLEVPDDWQALESYTGRLWDVLWMAKVMGLQARPGTNPIPFEVFVTNNLTHRREKLRLLCKFDGDVMKMYFPSDD